MAVGVGWTRICDGGGGGTIPSLSIKVFSDAEYTVPVVAPVAYTSTVYIQLDSEDITPTTHTLFFGNGTKNAPQVEFIGTNQYAWVVSLTGSITISATATDGTDATADATPFTLTSALVITNALVFDGVNDYAIFTPRINSSDNFSVSMWIKLLSISGVEAVFTIGNMLNSGIAPFLFGYYNDKWEVLSDPGWNFSDGYAWTRDTNWHHVTVTRSETTNEQLFYLDGVYVANLGTQNLVGLFDKFIIGFNNGTYGNMEISDFAIHNTVLTPAEITAMQALGVTSGHEVQRFPFTESVGTTSGYITDIINGDQMIIRNMTSGFGVQIRS